jgi:hypothetical protein
MSIFGKQPDTLTLENYTVILPSDPPKTGNVMYIASIDETNHIIYYNWSDESPTSESIFSNVRVKHKLFFGNLTNIDDYIQSDDTNLTIKSGGILNLDGTTSVNISVNGSDELVITGASTTFNNNIVIPDAGTIGSSSYTDAMSISSMGVVNISATTVSTSPTTGALTVGGGVGIAKDLSIGNDVSLLSDGAVLNFGIDSDVTLTHNPNIGLLLNESMKLLFRDSNTHISSHVDGYMNIQSNTGVNININNTDRLQITDTTSTFGTIIVIPDAGTIGSTSDTDAISISSTGVVNISANIASTNASTGALTVGGGVGIANDLYVGTGFNVNTDGDTNTKSLNNHNGGITNVGPILGATTIDGTGALKLTSGAASSWSTTSGALTLDGTDGIIMTTTDTSVGIKIGTSSSGVPITIGYIDSPVTVNGDLTVNGTTTTVNTETLVVADKNIEMGAVAGFTDTTADNGGITLRGDTDKTIQWDTTNKNWTSSEHFNVSTGMEYKIENVKFADATGLYSIGLYSNLLQSNSSENLVLQTGSDPSGSITITNGANGNINITPHGIGTVTGPTAEEGTTTTQLATTEFVTVATAAVLAATNTALDALDLKAPLASPAFTGTVTGITATMVGLGNVDNTTDANKPVSSATQTVLNSKADLASPAFTGTVTGINKTMVGLTKVDNIADIDKQLSIHHQTALDSKADLASPTFTGTVGGITKAMVGLANVHDTPDEDKPISTHHQAALDTKASLDSPVFTLYPTATALLQSGNNSTRLATTAYVRTNVDSKANLASPTFTGTVSGITKAMVGLTSADDTSDTDKPVSTATQTALDLKADLASPTFTGVPSASTAATATNTSQLATTKFVMTQAALQATLSTDNIFASATESTSKTTGAMTVTGGVGITLALQVGGDVTASASSDKRLKTNITKIENPLVKLDKINGYTFDWIPTKDVHSNVGRDIGVIAQEIEEVLPEITVTRDNGYKAVKYEKIVPLLIECIKEQQKQIDELRRCIELK